MTSERKGIPTLKREHTINRDTTVNIKRFMVQLYKKSAKTWKLNIN